MGHWSSHMRSGESSQKSPPASFRSSAVYTSLLKSSAFRLLRLYGSQSQDDPIHCSLEVHDLADPCLPVFEALSYTWADADGDNSLSEYVFVGSSYNTLLVTRTVVNNQLSGA
jgi:hypothetical protein